MSNHEIKCTDPNDLARSLHLVADVGQVVKKLARAGKIPAVKIGKSWRFNVEELTEWVKRQK